MVYVYRLNIFNIGLASQQLNRISQINCGINVNFINLGQIDELSFVPALVGVRILLKTFKVRMQFLVISYTQLFEGSISGRERGIVYGISFNGSGGPEFNNKLMRHIQTGLRGAVLGHIYLCPCMNRHSIQTPQAEYPM
jgi:hypothetical protein